MYTNNSFKRSGGYFQFSIFWRCWQNAFNIFGTLYKMYVLATFTITSGFFFLMLSEQHFSQSNIEYKSKSWNQKNDFSLSQKSCGQMIVPFEQLLLFLPLLYLSLLPQIKDKVIDYWLVLLSWFRGSRGEERSFFRNIFIYLPGNNLAKICFK